MDQGRLFPQTAGAFIALWCGSVERGATQTSETPLSAWGEGVYAGERFSRFSGEAGAKSTEYTANVESLIPRFLVERHMSNK